MLTSLTLAYFYGRPGDDSIMPAQSVSAPAASEQAPAQPAAPAAPAPAEQAK
jgi:preprotein translocase subunit SecG